MKWRVLIVVLLALTCSPIAVGTADGPQPPPGTYTGTLDGTPYEIVVPPNWNGTLLVFAHGQQLTAPTPVVAPPPVKAQLLTAGYALAGSGFTNSYKDGVQRTHQLTGFFREAFSNPHRIIIWGNSLGGAITAKLIEKYPGIYDGAIANCAPDAGAVENMDSALAFSLAFDAAFSVSGKGGWPRIGDRSATCATTSSSRMCPHSGVVHPSERGRVGVRPLGDARAARGVLDRRPGD
jgi:pimeloyl-ACP methyl ester carboxylesterase